jgi:hypothetical protein
VVQRERLGPFLLLRTDDGTTWIRGTLLSSGGFHRRRAGQGIPLTRLRQLVRAIERADRARDGAALDALAAEIGATYPDDYAACELLADLARRRSALTRDLPPAA